MFGNVAFPWFIPAILGLYFVYPLLYKLFFEEGENKPVKIAAVLVLVFFFYSVMKGVGIEGGLFYDRLAVILCGVVLGKSVYEKHTVKLWQGILILALFGVTLTLHCFFPAYSIRCAFYFFCTLVLLFLLSHLYRFNQRFLKFLNVVFCFIGGFTLEIYLTHENVILWAFRFCSATGMNVAIDNVYFQLFCYFFSIAVGLSLGALVRFVAKKIRGRKRKRPPSAPPEQTESGGKTAESS